MTKGIAIAVSTGILLWLSAALHTADAGSREDQQECAEVKAKIRAIQDRMRAGYTARQGRRYEDRLRQLREKRRRVCR